MEAKKAAILRFMQSPLKQPSSREVLQKLLNDEELLHNTVFVENRTLLPNTLVIAQENSTLPGFELELGVQRFEEVSIVNGRLVRHMRKTCRLRVLEPMQALAVLRSFSDKLFVEFGFAGRTPSWYKKVVSPGPIDKESRTFVNVIDEIVSDQIDLALWLIVLRERIDRALEDRDEESFRRDVGLYNKVKERCLWDLD